MRPPLFPSIIIIAPPNQKRYAIWAMAGVQEILLVALLEFVASGSYLIGLGYSLYFPMSKGLLSAILAFASGALICALAIGLAFSAAEELHHKSFSTERAWLFVGGGLALGAVFYYVLSLFLDQEGAAIRYPTRFREYARKRKRQDTAETIALLAKSNLLCHLPPEDIEKILPIVRRRSLEPGEVLFRTGDRGDALYIVANGKVEVVDDTVGDARPLAELGEGQTFGEMALLSGGPRTATVMAIDATEVMEIERKDFRDLMARDRVVADTVQRLSYDRAIRNLSTGGTNPDLWAKVATASVEQLTHKDEDRILAEAAQGAGLAIVFGSFLDTVPGCIVIGAKFSGLDHALPLTLILALFLSGIPEAAASCAMLLKAGFRPRRILMLWSTVIVAGVAAAVLSYVGLAGSESLAAVFCQALAGGAILGLTVHTLIPEAIDEGGSLVVLPTVAGFVIALYLSLVESFG